MKNILKIVIIALLSSLFSSGDGKDVYFYESIEKEEIQETSVLSFESIAEKISIDNGGKNKVKMFHLVEKEPLSNIYSALRLLIRPTPTNLVISKTELYILYCSLKLHA